MRRAARSLIVAALSIVAVVIGSGVASPVSAHEGAARIDATVEPNGPLSVTVDATIVYQLDLHPATPRTFTAQPVGVDGTELEAVPFEPTDDEGHYTAVVDFPTPGEWSLRLASTFPPGEIEVPATVDAATTSTAVSPSSEAPSAATEGSPAGEATLVSSGGGNDPPVLLTGGIVVLVLLVVGGAVALVVVRRRRARED